MEIYKRGSSGEVVKKIQRALNLLEDGIFGPLTEERVREFQMDNGLKPDGIIGPATLAKLIPCCLRKSKRTITEIIIHCTATPEGKSYTVEDIRRWHKQQGWSDIGYHYVILLDGTIERGRPEDIIGAHCTGHNSHSIGVVYVGGVAKDGKKSKDTRRLAQKAALFNLLVTLKNLYPNAKIYGHHDFDKGKDCPCFDVKTTYANI